MRSISKTKGKSTVDKNALRSFTGLSAWVANLCPQVSPFSAMLWAALASRPGLAWIYLQQVSVPLSWVLAFTTELNGPLIRHFRPRAETVTILTFDGSPSGGGATVQLAVPLRADRVKAPISFYWATRWTHDDESLLGASVGAARAQAKWEA